MGDPKWVGAASRGGGAENFPGVPPLWKSVRWGLDYFFHGFPHIGGAGGGDRSGCV